MVKSCRIMLISCHFLLHSLNQNPFIHTDVVQTFFPQ
jgi:hypothetical protein